MFLVYSLSVVNTDGAGLDSIELREMNRIESENNYLELADRFEIFMEDFATKVDLERAKIFFLVGPKAGFTDSRVIFTWLRTNKMFNQESDYFVSKIPDEPSKLSGDYLNQLLEKAAEENSQSLLYSKEPNIGKNKRLP